MILKLSSPPTMAKLNTTAYEGAQCEIWPWPPPKPPVEFCMGVNVCATLQRVNWFDSIHLDHTESAGPIPPYLALY